jgi:hypothetical protein
MALDEADDFVPILFLGEERLEAAVMKVEVEVEVEMEVEVEVEMLAAYPALNHSLRP